MKRYNIVRFDIHKVQHNIESYKEQLIELIGYTADERELIAFKAALYGGEYTYNQFV